MNGCELCGSPSMVCGHKWWQPSRIHTSIGINIITGPAISISAPLFFVSLLVNSTGRYFGFFFASDNQTTDIESEGFYNFYYRALLIHWKGLGSERSYLCDMKLIVPIPCALQIECRNLNCPIWISKNCLHIWWHHHSAPSNKCRGNLEV